MLRPANLPDSDLEANRIHLTIERDIPPLSYEVVEGNLKNVQGKVLTLIEASVDKDKLQAIKGLIRGFFNDSLTNLFDMYGHQTNKDIPSYSDEAYVANNQ